MHWKDQTLAACWKTDSLALCPAQLAPKSPKLSPEAVLRHVGAPAADGGAGWPADLLQVLWSGRQSAQTYREPSNPSYAT